jgi:hypothetical protein
MNKKFGLKEAISICIGGVAALIVLIVQQYSQNQLGVGVVLATVSSAF